MKSIIMRFMHIKELISIMLLGLLLGGCSASYDPKTGKKTYLGVEVAKEVGQFVIIDKLPVPK